jgi:peptide deformylase
MIRQIVLEGDPVLRAIAADVHKVSEPIKKLIEDMLETCEANGGVGLAAPQVGVSKRIIVVIADGERFGLVNPVLIKGSDQAEMNEACLSLPGCSGLVKRFKKVSVKGLNGKGKCVNIFAEGLIAQVLQHEIDHLNGILFTDLLIFNEFQT